MRRRRRLFNDSGGLGIGDSLVCWWHASSVAKSGTAVSALLDRSGNENDIDQGSGGLQPIFSPGAVNGRDAVRFTADAMDIDDNSTFNHSGAISLFIVAQNIADSAQEHNLIRKWTNSGQLEWLINIDDGGATQDLNYGVSDDGTSTEFELLNQPAYGTTFIAEIISDGTSGIECYLNNSNVTASKTSINSGTDSILLGQGTSGVDFYFCEALLYNRAVSTAERTIIRRYLNNEWGLSITP